MVSAEGVAHCHDDCDGPKQLELVVEVKGCSHGISLERRMIAVQLERHMKWAADERAIEQVNGNSPWGDAGTW